MTIADRTFRAVSVMAVLLTAWVPSISIAFAEDDPVIEQIVLSEAAAIGAAWKIKPQLELPDSSPLDSHPRTGVTMGRRELAQLLAGVKREMWPEAIRFLVAHEFWHQVQFREQGADILTFNSDLRRLAECQADLMAGHYMLTSLSANLPNSGSVFKAVTQLAADMGVARYAKADHPSKAQRLIAVQIGMTRALVNVANTAPAIDERDGLMAMLSNLIDLRATESEWAWSVRQCKRIVQYHSNAITSLAIEQPEINWNRDPAVGTVSFALPYRNIGERPLRVSLEVLSAAVPRNGERSIDSRMRIMTHTEDFELQPGSTHVVRGTLRWYGDVDLMATLVFPRRDEGALISVEFAGAAAPPDPAETQDMPASLPSSAARLGDALAKLARGASNNFTEFRSGGGQVVAEDTVIYPSSVAIPNALDTDIWVQQNGSASVEATLFRGELDEARRVYEHYRKDVHLRYPFKYIKDRTSSTTGMPRFTVQIAPQAQLEISVSGEHSGKHSVNLSVDPTRW